MSTSVTPSRETRRPRCVSIASFSFPTIEVFSRSDMYSSSCCFLILQEIQDTQNIPSSTRFAPYSSPLSSYPLLHIHSPQHLLDSVSLKGMGSSAMKSNFSGQDWPDSNDPSVIVGIDLRSLKAAAVNRWLSDPSKRLCQYEVPGGGECRDRDCEDIHLSSAWTVEPSGTPCSLLNVIAYIFILSSVSLTIVYYHFHPPFFAFCLFCR
jgi:hypothetical protein